MTNRVSALPLHLLSLSNAFEGCALTADGAGRRLGTGRADYCIDVVASLSRSARSAATSVHHVVTGLGAADAPGGLALSVPAPVRDPRPVQDYPWPDQLPAAVASDGDLVNDVLRVAASQIGVREAKTNRTEYGKSWGVNGVFWCAQFVSWVFAKSGHALPQIQDGKSGFAYCQYGRDEAYRRKELYARPRPGDIFFHFSKGDRGSGHTGIVVEVLPDGRVVTIEGNATGGSATRDGGGVVKQTRTLSYTSGLTFWRVLPAAADDDRGPEDLAPAPSNLRPKSRRRKR